MNIVWVLLLLVSFVCFAVYVVKGGSMFIGSLTMGLLWALIGVLAGVVSPADIPAKIMTGPLTQGATIITMFFGSWFGMMLVESGIAPSIIRKTIELSGDKKVLTTILLSLVTCLIFCSCFGPGPVMGIGVIVFPILLSIGIPKAVALCSFLISVGAGMYINPTFHAQIVGSNLAARGIEDQFDMAKLRSTGYIGMAIQMAVVIVMILVLTKRMENTSARAWAATTAPADQAETKMTPMISFLAPLVPITLIALLGWDPVPAFTVACLYALVTCGQIKSYADFEKLMNRSFCSGVESLAPMMGFLVCQTMFVGSANAVSGLIAEVLDGVFPSSCLLMTVLFILILPLGYFRGPATLCGTGTILLSILLAMGFAPQFVITAMLYTSIGTTISSCPTQSWSIWGMSYTKVETKEFMLTGIPWAAAATALNIVLVFLTAGAGV